MTENNIEVTSKTQKVVLLALHTIKLVKNLTKNWHYWYKVVS